MPNYNLGTASGRIVLDASGAVLGAGQAEAAAGKVGGSFGKASGAAIKAGGVLTAGAAAVAVGFGAAIHSAADFEKQISGIAAVSGATGPELEDIRKKALQLGKDTQFSASEAANAIEELVKAGIPVADVLNGAADAAVSLAAAGGVGIPEAATLAANAMNAFGINAKDLGGVVDQIAGAANASAIDVGEFGQSLQQVGAVAHLAGLSFDDTAVAIAELGNAGIKGSDAGTSLKTFLQNLIPVTDKEKGLMQDLGIISVDTTTAMKTLAKNGIKPASDSFDDIISAIEKYNAANGGAKVGTEKAGKEALIYAQSLGVVKNQFFDAQGNTKKLADLQNVLAGALHGMSKEQKLATLQTLFGSDAIRAASVLADNAGDKYTKLNDAINSTSAADVAKKRMDNLSGSMEQLKGSLETAGIVIGTILIPAVRSLVDFVTKILNAFLSLNPNVQKAILIFVGVAAAVTGLIGMILLIGGAIATILPVLAAIAGAIGIGVGAMLGWVLIIPIIIAAIAVLVFFIVKNFDHIKSFIGKVLSAIKNFFVGIFTAIIGFLKPIMKKLLDLITLPLRLYLAYVRFVFGLVHAIISTALNVLMAIWKGFWDTFGGLVQAVLGTVIALVRFVFTLMAVIIYQQMRLIKAVVEAVWGAIKAFITPVLNFLLALVTRVFNGWKNIVTAVFNFLKPYIATAIAIIKASLEAIGAVVGRVIGFFASIYNGIKEKVAAVISFVGGIAGKIKSAIGDLSRLLYDVGKSIIQGLISGITDMFDKVKGTLNGLTDKLGDWKGPLSKDKILLEQNGVVIMKSLINGFVDQIPEVRATLEGITTEIPAAVGTQTSAPQIVVPVIPAQATGGGDKNVSLTVNNYNPIAEKESVSMTKAASRLAALEVV